MIDACWDDLVGVQSALRYTGASEHKVGGPKTRSAGVVEHAKPSRVRSMVPRSMRNLFWRSAALPEAKKAVEGIIAAGLGRAAPRRQTLLALPEDRPTPRARTSDSIPPPQAASARPNHEAPRSAATVRGDHLCAARARLGHADDHQYQTGGAELPPRGACDRDAVDADAAPRPPAKAVLNSLELCAAGDPARRFVVRSSKVV